MNSDSDAYILAKFDVSGIQKYIFATNKLRENIGASYQVTRILEEFLPDAIKKGTTSQQEYVVDWEMREGLSISENEDIKAEIIYIGGGNAMVLFRDSKVYQTVCQNLGKKAAESCQGIYVTVACQKTGLQNFEKDMMELSAKMAKSKAEMIRQPIYSPFPVVEQDNSNHQPIARCYRYKKKSDKIHENLYTTENMTEMNYQKWIAYQWSRRHKSKKLYPAINGLKNYDYPVEMDYLCRKHGEDSYIAVVHIDGNGMGRQFQEVWTKCEEFEKAVPMLRARSKEISAVFKNTYRTILLKLGEHEELLNTDSQGEMIYPLRPIVLDGDDFTFMCTADLAVLITAGFLTELSKNQEERAEKITACAGIAFVHSHFPFYEAYRAAEDSCSRAKNKWYEEKKRGNQANSFLDFQIIKGNQIKGSQEHEEWKIRPYSVLKENEEFRSDSLVRLFDTIKVMEEKWPSNRLHKIYQAMLEGEEQMHLLEKEFLSRKYQMKDLIQTENWKTSPLYDALELRGLCRTELMTEFFEMQEKRINEKMEFKDNTKK